MAQYERQLRGDLNAFVDHVEDAILRGSLTANSEASSEHAIGDARMVVRTYERYSAMGKNRVSLTVSVLAVGDELSVSLVSAGGSQALFFKINTFGEGAFLDTAVDAVEWYAAQRG